MPKTKLTKAQLGLYVECLNAPQTQHYHIPYVYELDATLDAERLCRAIEATIMAHPILFTRIVEEEMEIQDEKIHLEVEDIASTDDLKTYIEPFDIEGGRLFHVHLLKDEQHYYLFWDCHHLINDGTSLQIFLHDLEAAYNGTTLEPEAYTLMDYAREEEALLGSDAYEQDKQWYSDTFDCEDISSPISPDLETGTKGHILRTLDISMADIETFCKKNAVYKSTLMTTAYAFLLARYNHEEQSLIRTGFNGRTDGRLKRTQGMFVRTIPMYCHFEKDTKTLDLLHQQQEQMKGCREHQAYPWMDMVHDLHLEADNTFVWHGELFNDDTLMGKPIRLIQLQDEREGDKVYLKAYAKNREIHIRAEYDGTYSETLICQFVDSYEQVLRGFLSQEFLRDISLTNEQQLSLLDSFNQTDVPYNPEETVLSCFRQHVAQHPDKVALAYKDQQYTYRQVDDLSNRIAGYLIEKGFGREDVISILIPRCEWMLIAPLGVLKAGCAYQPLDPTYPEERLKFMQEDADSKLLLTLDNLPTIAEHATIESRQTATKPEDLFTILYTSGSTGVPKGCQLEHRHVMAFCHMHCHNLLIDADSRVGAYASFGFDACLQELWATIVVGATIYIIPEELRLDLVALNDYFEQNGITHTFMTTQVARQFVNDIDNHSLKAFITGGEKLADVTPPPYLLLNGYGPSESICYVTAYPVKEVKKNIPIGKAVENMHLYVVDAFGHRQPIGAAGELWINGPQVGRGYLNRPEKTAESFVQSPWGRCYRTGDIVRYLPDGNLEFVGRKDGQVKIRGFRIELKEVESIIREFPGIKDVTVQAFDEEGGGKFIAAYIVSDEQIDIAALNTFIMEEKPPYMVPAATMQIESIPLNQNQKVDKKALPMPVKSVAMRQQQTEQPLNVLEAELKGLISDIIKTDQFGITDILGFVGLTSITAIKLATQIYKQYGITLDAKSLVKGGTLQSIENEILEGLLTHGQPSTDNRQLATSDIPSPTLKSPLSYSQMGVYVECMKNPASTLYNIPSMIGFPRDTDCQKLLQAIETVIKAHPLLQARFDSEGSDIIQVINPDAAISIPHTEMTEEELTTYKQDFMQPFNLKQGPLYRMEIVSTEQRVCLLADVHHLVFDGGSFDLFLHQVCDLMEGKDIEAEDQSYTDFVRSQKEAEKSEEYAAARDFFHSKLSGCEGTTEVQSDLTNPIEQGVTECVYMPLDFPAIETFCRQHQLTPSHLTLAAVMYTLGRFTNNEQLCITTISNGRSDLRIRNTIGMFVNTLPLTATIGDQRIGDFLHDVSETFDETLRHENYPFAQIASDYDLSSEIMFAYQVGVIDQYVCQGQPLTIENMELNVPKFRIAIYIKDGDGEHQSPGVCIEYDNGRYSHALMQHLAKAVINAIHGFIQQPEGMLQQVSLLDQEQEAILDRFNETTMAYDDTQTIVSLFRQQVVKTPDNLAVVYHDKQYTYRQVDEMSERIAGYLTEKGFGREDVISILIPRCEWMLIASLGVLKAGCAYQPLDPTYPDERLQFMQEDANSKLLLTLDNLPTIAKYAAMESQHTGPKPDDLFILLYTSGSTGVPKGCQLEHRNLVAFCHWYQRYYELTADSKVAAYASYGFDACMMDMYPAITCGACVHIIGDDIRLNLPDLNNYFNENGITHSFITTQVGYQFATNVDNHSLRCFSVGGEKLSALQPPKNYKMYNGYGPTECTIFTTTYLLKEYEQDIPIGKPTDNTRLYIVDKQLNRLPPGAAGELWVSGPQVGRGYLNRPEKNAEVFVESPWGRCYRTGDIVRYLPDGNIQFVGRKDSQVKIRGFRIELKEVESIIREYEGIKDATVQAFDYPNGGKYIAAYIVSDQQVDIKKLHAFIGEHKPPYMIPATTMQIDTIPLNQNQKVNRKMLPAPVIKAEEREYVAPSNETEQLFCRIFGDILSIDKVGATDNFFEMGGTSLMVTRVIIETDKAGHHIAYGDLFSHPTARQLTAFLSEDSENSGNQEDAQFDYHPIDALLMRNTLDAFKKGERQQIGNVLLTGATGYLGIHVLKVLIEREDVPVIWCMVRAQNMDKAERRLKGLLFYYYANNYKELFGNRLRIVLGDVTQPIKVDGHVDTVFNCAAVVKHFSKGTEIEDVNIGGAVNCIRFCLETGARLTHISTYSTAGLSINGVPSPDTIQTEQKLYYGQYMDNRYVHSKFVAERTILEAVAVHQLNAKVMRVGNLSPRSTDGEFQINFQTNSAMGRVRLYKVLGCYPYEQTDQPMEFSPINEVAHAVVVLSETPRECCLFHPFNNHSVLFGDVLSGLHLLGNEPRQVETTEFQNTLEHAKDDPEKARFLQSIIAYQDMAHGQQTVPIATSNTYTTQVLYRLGFRWSPTSWDYVYRFLAAIDGLGYFES